MSNVSAPLDAAQMCRRRSTPGAKRLRSRLHWPLAAGAPLVHGLKSHCTGLRPDGPPSVALQNVSAILQSKTACADEQWRVIYNICVHPVRTSAWHFVRLFGIEIGSYMMRTICELGMPNVRYSEEVEER